MSAGLGAVLAAFVVLSAVLAFYARKLGPFGGLVAALVIGFVFFRVVFPGAFLPGGGVLPGIAMAVAGAANPLPVPAMAFWSYVALVGIGALLVGTADDGAFRELLRPPARLLSGDGFGSGGRALRSAVLWIACPLLSGWLVLRGFMPSTQSPVESRLAHPTISYDADLENPYRKLAGGDLANALMEGRHLYGQYCSPCHGGKADGTGPIARALRLRPANFTDPGTIATLVEGYAFQRVMDGGIRLPAEGAPWDSAMPSWKGDLTFEQVFKILLAEYDLAGVSPRVPEKAE